MNRIFSARINIDDLAASLALCITDKERAAWSQGLVYGLSGGPRREGMPPAFDAAWAVGADAHAAARQHQALSGKGGKTTMARHPEARIDKRSSTDVRPEVRPDVTPDPPLEQSNNRIIEESKEPENENTFARHVEHAPVGHDGPAKASPEKITMANDAWWDEFWSGYGKKVGKQAAWSAWCKLTDAERTAALDRLSAYVAAHPDSQYRKDPVRYLRHKAWEDELPAPANPHPPGTDAAINWDAEHADWKAWK